MTKGKRGDIISRLSRKTAADRSLKIEQQREKYEAKHLKGTSSECVKYDLAILKENTTQTKVREQIKLERLDRTERCVLIPLFREFDPGSG